MRYTQILLSIIILCVCSTISAGERPESAPPIDERLTGIEDRLDNHESRIDALEGKEGSCPCPDGPCICDAEDCECEDCPEHGYRLLFFTADWCKYCEPAKKRLGKLMGHVTVMDCTKPEDMQKARSEYGVKYLPTVMLVVGGEEKSRCVGKDIGKTIVGGWLNPSAGAESRVMHRGSARSVPAARTYRSRRYVPPAMYRPRTYFRPAPRFYLPTGQAGGGGCATCR